jgi:hypothetical protein
MLTSFSPSSEDDGEEDSQMGSAIVPEAFALAKDPSLQKLYENATWMEGAEGPGLSPQGPRIRIGPELPHEDLNVPAKPEGIAQTPDQNEQRGESRGDDASQAEWGDSEPGDFSASGEIVKIDDQEDPPAVAPDHVSELCSYESWSKLEVRTHVKRPEEMLRSAVWETLREMEEPFPELSPKVVAADEAFLQEITDHILDAEQFIAGSFQNNFAAWEELLRGSTRQSSKKVLKWIRDIVRPIFDGTQHTEPKKMRRARSLLRQAVPKNQVENFLSGKVPHEIEFQNHQSVYQHLPFSIKTVKNLVVTGTAHLYSPKEGKPKVVNPWGFTTTRATA